MNAVTKEMVHLMEILPEGDQNLALELVRKLVLAWDPDFTKVTPEEAEKIEQGMNEIEHGEIVAHNEIDWD